MYIHLSIDSNNDVSDSDTKPVWLTHVLYSKADFHEVNCAANSPRNLTKHAQFE